MLRFPILYGKGMRPMMFQLSGFCYSKMHYWQKAECGSFRKLGVPYLGVLVIRILLFRVLY